MSKFKAVAYTVKNSNWDICITHDDKLAAIAKGSASDSHFGDKNHIKRLMNAGFFDDNAEWTEEGLEYMYGIHSALTCELGSYNPEKRSSFITF